MKIQRSSYEAESAYKAMVSESIVEGRLSLPVEKDEIDRVLFVHGKVHTSAESADGKVFMDGNVTFTVVYMTAEGNIDAFDSAAPFRHTEDAPGLGAGMNVFVTGSIKEVSYSLEDGRAVYVKGIVSMTIRGNIPVSYDAVQSSDLDGLQMKMHTSQMAVTKELKKQAIMIREDIRVPQSMPRAERILFCDAYAVVRSIRTEELKIVVEGDIKMMVLYMSEDKSAPLQYFYESMPFGEMLSSESVASGDIVTADVSLYGVGISIAEEESDIFRLTAKLDMVCSVRSMQDVMYMEDAYSLHNKLIITHKDHEVRSLKQAGSAKAIARCAIIIPDSEPPANRVVCMKACPVISAATPGTDRVYIEGLMMYTICYASPQGMTSYDGEVPFEAEAQMEGLQENDDVEVGAEVEYCSFEGAGRDINVRFMMDVMIHAYEVNRMHLISDMEETDEAMVPRKGITIYFADGGESIWDIAKRYSTTLDTVKKYNPDIGDSAEAGQKILIMG